jgi:hypothetical protein
MIPSHVHRRRDEISDAEALVTEACETEINALLDTLYEEFKTAVGRTLPEGQELPSDTSPEFQKFTESQARFKSHRAKCQSAQMKLDALKFQATGTPTAGVDGFGS